MIKTMYIFFRLLIDLFIANKKLAVVKKLDKAGDIAGRDAYIKTVTAWWGKRIFEFGKTQVEIIGIENVPKEGAVLFVGNHQSMMDIPLILGYAEKQLAFIAKMELSKVPIVAPWMKYMQCIFMDRKDRKQSIIAMEEAVQSLKNGYSQVIFPEGTRSHGGQMQEFKRGSFKLGLRAEVPIVPVTIDGTWQMMNKNIGFEKAHVKLTIHKPLNTKGLTKEDQNAIPEIVEKIVRSALPSESSSK